MTLNNITIHNSLKPKSIYRSWKFNSIARIINEALRSLCPSLSSVSLLVADLLQLSSLPLSVYETSTLIRRRSKKKEEGKERKECTPPRS